MAIFNHIQYQFVLNVFAVEVLNELIRGFTEGLTQERSKEKRKAEAWAISSSEIDSHKKQR